MRVAIIGGGIAGSAAAYFLKQYGAECVIFDSASEIASGASGNPYGMYNPRLSAMLSPEAIFYRDAFELALDVLPSLEDVGLNMCGNLVLVTDERKQVRFTKMLSNWGWGEDMARLVSAAEASEIAGVALSHDALFMPKAGIVSPRRVCAALVQGAETRYGQDVRDTSEVAEGVAEEFDAVVLACGAGSLNFAELDYLPLKVVRGQITQVRASEVSAELKTALGFGGYMTPAIDGVHIVGATFDRGAAYSDVYDADDAENISRLAEAVPDLVSGGLEVVGRRASVRLTADKAYFPIIGALPAHLSCHSNVYVSIAHGSHGIVSALKGGELLAQKITGQDKMSLPDEVLARLSPSRYN